MYVCIAYMRNLFNATDALFPSISELRTTKIPNSSFERAQISPNEVISNEKKHFAHATVRV